MTTNSFETETSNANIGFAQYYVDDDGSFKFTSPILQSSNFDGSVPIIEGTIDAEEIKSGMSIKLDGSYYSVIDVFKDDPDLEDDPSEVVSISYINNNNETQEIDYDFSDQVEVRYENWDEKFLGNQGWALTYGGNAIFSNVGVRGTIEALDGDIGGWLITGQEEGIDGALSYDASIPAGLSGSGAYLTGIYTGFGIHTDNWEAESEIHQPSKIFMVYGPGLDSSVPENLVPSWNDHRTTFYVDGHGYFSLGNKLTFNSNTGELNIGGYATDQNLEDLDFLSGEDIFITGTTNISGGRIRTGIIQSNDYSGVNDGTNFSSSGLAINLTTGALTAKAFRIDASGNSSFKGNLQALSGYFGSESNGITIGLNGNGVALETTTLKIGSSNVGGVTYGSINFYTTSGVSLGQISATNANKTWLNAFGQGVGFGTPSDFLLLPESGNANRARYQGNGFDWLSSNGTSIMSITG